MTVQNRCRNLEIKEGTPLDQSTENIIGNKTETEGNWQHRCMDFFQNITVEPTVILFMIPYMISSSIMSNLSIEKACRVNFNFTDEICTAMREQNLESQNQYEREVQGLVTSAMAWKTYLTATIPCVLGMFVGPWQDKTGHRKIFLVLGIAIVMLGSVNCIIQVYFFHELNLQVLVFTDALIETLSGGMCVFSTTIFAYISAITTVKSRTFRMGLVNFCVTIGIPIGTAISGFLLKYLGYYGAYGIVLFFYGINFPYNIFLLKDPKRDAEQKKHDRKGVGHFFKTFFDLSNIKDTVKVVFKNGPNNRRLRVIILLLITTILSGPMYGETSIMYMSTRYRFNWDEVQFSLFQTYNFITHTIGTLFSITVFSKYLQWNDSVLGIISTVSKIAASFVYCFAPSGGIFYIAPLVEILNGTSMIAVRSITSKLVQTNELGKVNAVFALTESLMPLVYVTLYTQVYTATMEVLPGAVFLMGAVTTVPALIVFIVFFTEHRRGLRKKPIDNETEIPVNTIS